MNEVMTWDEIKKKYDHHYILIVDPVMDEERGEVVSGEVICASPDRRAVHQAAMAVKRGSTITVECTIPEDPNLAYLL